MVCTPATFANGPRSRAITASDDMPRSDSGFRLTVRLPRLIELQPFDTPTVEADAGHSRIGQHHIDDGALPILHRLERHVG